MSKATLNFLGFFHAETEGFLALLIGTEDALFYNDKMKTCEQSVCMHTKMCFHMCTRFSGFILKYPGRLTEKQLKYSNLTVQQIRIRVFKPTMMCCFQESNKMLLFGRTCHKTNLLSATFNQFYLRFKTSSILHFFHFGQ